MAWIDNHCHLRADDDGIIVEARADELALVALALERTVDAPPASRQVMRQKVELLERRLALPARLGGRVRPATADLLS